MAEIAAPAAKDTFAMPKILALGSQILLLSTLLSACATSNPTPSPSESTPDVPPTTAPERGETAPAEVEAELPKLALSKEWLFGMLLADIAAQRGERQLSADAWLQVAKETQDPRAARRALEIAYSAGKIDNALQAAQLWRKLDPQQELARQMLASLLARSGRLAEAEAEIQQWLRERPQDAPSLFRQAHTLWPPQADKQTVLAITQRLANPHPQLAEAALAVALAASSAGNSVQALSAAEQAVQRKPDWETAILYRAALTEGQSSQAAIDYLRAASQRLPKSRDIQSALARKLADARQYQEAGRVYAALKTAYPTEVEYPVGEALAAIQSRNYPQAEVALEQALRLGVDKPDALRYYMGIVAEEQFKLAAAREHYAQVGDGEMGVQAATRLARVEAKLGNQAAALQALQRLPNRSPADQIARVQVEAQIWRELKNLPQARSTLDAGLRQHPDSSELLYDRSLILDLLGDLTATEQDLRRYLSLKPDNALGLNALGYTLANRTQRFDEAEALLQQALKLEPDNPIIQDSMGWLELRRGNVGQAVEWLRRAYTGMPDPEIAAHYGEALWRQGKRSEARKVWAEGEKLDPQHEVLQETLQRLGAR